MAFLDNYEDVAARIQRFWATYPNGRIETNILDFNAEKGYVLIQCKVWRDMEDLNPAGTDIAFGNVATYNIQMKKFFCEDTSTSAIGRAIGLVLGSDKRPTAQNMAHVERMDQVIVSASANDVDLWQTNFGTIPSFNSAEAAEQSGIPSLGSSIDEIKSQLGGQLIEAAPQCKHGHMIFKHGDKNGRAWGGYMCVEQKKAAQCPPLWYTLASDGQWKPQV